MIDGVTAGRSRLRLFRVAAIVLAVAIPGLVVASVLDWGGHEVEDSIHNLAEIGAGLLAGTVGALAARRTKGHTAVAWSCWAVYCLVDAFAEGIDVWSTMVAHHALEFPSVVDFLFLAQVPGGIVAALVFIRASSTRLGTAIALVDALLIGAGVLIVAIQTILKPIASSFGSSPFASAVALAEPMTDIVVLTLIVMVAFRVGRTARVAPVLLCVGIASIAMGDGSFTYLDGQGVDTVGSTFSFGWTAGLLCIGLAALYTVCYGTRADFRLSPDSATGWGIFLPMAPVVAACAYLLIDFLIDPLTAGLAILAVTALIGLTLVRMGLSLYQHLRLSKHMAHLATHDELTGLPNRLLLRRRLERGQHPDHLGALALLVLDLDGFKAINDTFGHNFGDELLVQVTQRIAAKVRKVDLVARLGGDEFAVLIARTDAAVVMSIAHRILGALELPMTLGTASVSIAASIGVASTDDGDAPDDLLRNADLAMYAAKSAGGSRIATYEPRFHTAVSERMQLENSLRVAWLTGDLIVHYQPIVELETGRMVAVEALTRLRGPDGGMIPPDVFIPVAEETGLIVPIGASILGDACRSLAGWQSRHDNAAELAISVNLSPRQLKADDLVAIVAEVLRSTGIRPDLLILEITENALIDDVESAIRMLGRLKGLGVRLALDDFGVGASSLARLRRLPIDVVKIDKSLVDNVPDGHVACGVLEAVVGVARALQLSVVIEGVERADQAAHLREKGYEQAQGFYFARPADGSTIDAILTRAGAGSSVAGDARGPLAAAAGTEGEPGRVLIVEDDMEIAVTTRRILEREDARVMHAVTMHEARARLDEGVDVAIVDIGLPDGDGWDLIRSLRADERYADLPVVVMTGLADSAELLNRATELHCEYLGKPFAREALLAKLHAARERVLPLPV